MAAAPIASAAPVDPPAYAAKSVPEGVGAEGIWTGAFSVARKQGNEGLTFGQAYEHCIGAGKALCSETQWTRACEADGKLAELETWLATYDGKGKFAVRGGAGDVYGHRNISVQAGMPWAFQRVRHDGEVNLTEVSEEVLPASYIVWWASQQTTADLQTTLNHPEAEVDVKVIVGEELGSRA